MMFAVCALIQGMQDLHSLSIFHGLPRLISKARTRVHCLQHASYKVHVRMRLCYTNSMLLGKG